MPIRWASSFMMLISALSESSDSGSTVWELMILSTSMHARSQALFFPWLVQASYVSRSITALA